MIIIIDHPVRGWQHCQWIWISFFWHLKLWLRSFVGVKIDQQLWMTTKKNAIAGMEPKAPSSMVQSSDTPESQVEIKSQLASLGYLPRSVTVTIVGASWHLHETSPRQENPGRGLSTPMGSKFGSIRWHIFAREGLRSTARQRCTAEDIPFFHMEEIIQTCETKVKGGKVFIGTYVRKKKYVTWWGLRWHTLLPRPGHFQSGHFQSGHFQRI